MNIVCKLCGATHNSRKTIFDINNLAVFQKHLSSHKVDDEYIIKLRLDLFPDTRTTCCFCKNTAQFVSLNVGYKIVCESAECIKKSRSPNTVEYEMKVNGLSEDEAICVLTERSLAQRKKANTTMDKLRETDVDFDNKNSSYHKAFWIKKGYTEEESIQLAWDKTEKNRKKCAQMRINEPEHFNGTLTNQTAYWEKKLFTPEAAAGIVSQRQTTFSLDVCIDKYGEEEGLRIWKHRQEKWQNILANKSEEEKLEINRKKLTRNGAFSKASQDIFRQILYHLKDQNIINNENENEIFYYEHGGEKIIRIGNNHFKPDFLWNKVIIEFDGDYWHGSENARERDKIRNNKIKAAGYKMLNIKEIDYKKNSQAEIEKCLTFLKENIKITNSI